jgi:hypothetical protein
MGIEDTTKNEDSTRDPSYTEAVVQKKPHKDDQRELAITQKISNLALKTEWAQSTIAVIHDLQIKYLQEVVANIKDPTFVYKRTQDFLKELSGLLKAEILEGFELLKGIPNGSPALVMTNHLGLYKLASINPKQDLNIDIPGYDFMYPSPLYFAGLYPVAEVIGDNLSYVSDDFPGVFGEIHRSAGFVHVPPQSIEKTNRTEILQKQTSDVFNQHANTAIVNYPEGGTSGKYSGLGPYDLDPFKTGGYVIASKLGIRIIPVVQYFDPNKGLQLKVLQPYIPEVTDKAGYESMAEKDRQEMQKWLDERKA